MSPARTDAIWPESNVKQEIHDNKDIQRDSRETTTYNGITLTHDRVVVLDGDHHGGWRSFKQHVDAAYQSFREDEEDMKHNGYANGWRSDLWAFVRAIKAHPDVASLTAREALKQVETVLSDWTVHGLDRDGRGYRQRAAIRWETFFELEADDARAEFVGLWEKVRCPEGVSPFEHAIQRAADCPIWFEEDDEALSLDTPTYRRFLSIAGWLQVSTGDQNILLPCEKMAEVLGVKAMTISRYREFAVEDGFLTKVRAHNRGAKRATEFRFDVRRVPMLQRAAHQEA